MLIYPNIIICYLGRVYDESMVNFPNIESSYMSLKKKNQPNKKCTKDINGQLKGEGGWGGKMGL